METNTTFRTVAAAAFAAAALGLAACGGDDSSATASSDGDARSERREAMLAYARCMREHGIDFPDPQPGGEQMILRSGDDSPEKLRAAEEACAEHREAIRPPELSEEQRQERQDAALAHARCMREHGIDMPDPTFGSDGGARIRIGPGDGIDPDDPEFRAAQEACRDELPRLEGERP